MLLQTLLLIAPALLAQTVLAADYSSGTALLTRKTVRTQKRTVHVVFSNHADIGFDGIAPELGSDDNVINKYFDVFFPLAIETAANLTQHEPYVWTTQAWLLSMFLDCPPGMGLHCPGAAAVAAVEAAIRAGTITWHAFPFNVEMEMLEPSLLMAALDMTQALDRAYGLPPKRTISQRDVPGLTRAAVPLLANPRFQVGLHAISVGVNPGSAPPAVPKGPFWWRDESSGQQLIAMWHPGGYSGEPVDSKDECMRVEGFDHVLCCAWKGDNAGPHSPMEVMNILNRVRKSFPGWEVKASIFDAFVAPLVEATSPEASEPLQLPIISAEIGDTWIHGIASDAAKVSGFRSLQRVHSKLVYDHSQDAAFRNFTRLLLKIPEHTWGADTKVAMNDYVNWTNTDFSTALSSGWYDDILHTWRRQYRYLSWALEALKGNSVLWSAAQAFLALEKPLKGPTFLVEDATLQEEDTSLGKHTLTLTAATDTATLQDQGFKRLEGNRLRFQSSDWDLRLDADSGAVSGLVRRWDGRKGHQWASKRSPLAQVTYSTYVEGDFDAIWDHYAYQNGKPGWFQKDFGKPNCSRLASPKRADSVARLQEAWVQTIHGGRGKGFEVAVKVALPKWTVREAGAPEAVWLHYYSPATPEDDTLHVTVTWIRKTPTRLPEALWVDWQPRGIDATSWRLWKLGSPVDPGVVLRNGSQSMHGVGDQGYHVDAHQKDHIINDSTTDYVIDGGGSSERLSIRTLDAALVSPGVATPFPNPDRPPNMRLGVHSLLAANIWGTNYVMWQPYMDGAPSQRFRFVLQVQRVKRHETV